MTDRSVQQVVEVSFIVYRGLGRNGLGDGCSQEVMVMVMVFRALGFIVLQIVRRSLRWNTRRRHIHGYRSESWPEEKELAKLLIQSGEYQSRDMYALQIRCLGLARHRIR